jgi:hypothetical protein
MPASPTSKHGRRLKAELETGRRPPKLIMGRQKGEMASAAPKRMGWANPQAPITE